MADRLEENKAVARRFFTALSEGEVDEAVGLFSEEGSWWVAGQDGPGISLTSQQMAGAFQNVLSGPAKGVQYAERGLVAEGDQVVIEIVASGLLSNGNHYNNHFCFILEIKDGLIVGGHEYMDTAHSARAFAGALTSSASQQS
jgi:ketosteroid isomerase-like protein